MSRHRRQQRKRSRRGQLRRYEEIELKFDVIEETETTVTVRVRERVKLDTIVFNATIGPATTVAEAKP